MQHHGEAVIDCATKGADHVASRTGRATRMSARDWGWVALSVGLALALRLPFLEDPLESDEAGYLLVAQQWKFGDPTLYGDFWVDRPPLLLLLFKGAGLAGPFGVRLLGCVLVILLVSAAALAGRAVAGPRAARWSALVAACLGSSFALGAHAVNGELVAAPLVMASCAATLWAVYMPSSPRRRVALAVLAGVTGTSAVLVKQNFIDALVFAAVLLTLLLARHRDARRRILGVLVGGLAGIVTPLAAVFAWATWAGPGAGALLFAMYGFRLSAAEAIAAGDHERPELRLLLILAMAIVSGLLAVLVCALKRVATSTRPGDPLPWAFIAMLGAGAVGVAAGGSYWLHYLIQLVPTAALGAVLHARAGTHPRRFQTIIRLSVASSVTAMLVGVAVGQANGGPEASVVSIGQWLRSSSLDTDTALVSYGHPNILLEADLTSPYPYLWSLPTRVRDPHLSQLTQTVTGPAAPTWIVEWDDFNAWEIDDHHTLRGAVRANYHQAATICGHDIYLRNTRSRLLTTVNGRCGEF